MDPIPAFFNLILHFDVLLPGLIQAFGTWIYLVLFLVIFFETGLVITPFLPGDSLLFVAGSLAGVAQLNIWFLVIFLAAAAIIGDSANYWIGHSMGDRFIRGHSHFVKREYIDRTKEYFARYGSKTIVIARFIPVIRTFAPFLAGIGAMEYPRFLLYNILGGVAWVGVFVLSGYFFGNIPFIQEHFSLVVFAIIILSLVVVVQILWEVWKSGRSASGDTSCENGED
jgi:membrane-associated protein